MENLYKQKVLLVHNFYKFPGGEDTVFENEKRLLEENGHDVVTYTRSNNDINNFNFWQKLYYPINTIFSLKTYKDVKKIILDKKIDIVHVHNTWPLISPSVYYAAFYSEVPVYQTIHNFRMVCPGATLYHNGDICEDSLKVGLRKSVKNKIYKGSLIHTAISATTLKVHRVLGTYKKVNFIFLTEFTRQKVLELNKNGKKIIDDSRTSIKPNFTTDEHGLSESKGYYMFLGRLEEIKGIELLIKVFSELPEKKLLVIGNGDLENKISNHIKERNLNNIKLLGHKPKEEVNILLKGAEALIVPSQGYETFGMVILEAYSNGTPAIVGDIGNIKDLVLEGKTGLKFTYNSSEELIKAILKFEMMDRKELGKNAYDFFKNNYSRENNYEILYAIYSGYRN